MKSPVNRQMMSVRMLTSPVKESNKTQGCLTSVFQVQIGACKQISGACQRTSEEAWGKAEARGLYGHSLLPLAHNLPNRISVATEERAE